MRSNADEGDWENDTHRNTRYFFIVPSLMTNSYFGITVIIMYVINFTNLVIHHFTDLKIKI